MSSRLLSSPSELRLPAGDRQIVYAASKPVHWQRYDLEPTKRLLGFEPSEQWPQGIEIVLASRGA